MNATVLRLYLFRQSHLEQVYSKLHPDGVKVESEERFPFLNNSLGVLFWQIRHLLKMFHFRFFGAGGRGMSKPTGVFPWYSLDKPLLAVTKCNRNLLTKCCSSKMIKLTKKTLLSKLLFYTKKRKCKRYLQI